MLTKVVRAPQISRQEYEKYNGKDAAIYKGRIIASGKNSMEAIENALKKCPALKTHEIEIMYIQMVENLIL